MKCISMLTRYKYVSSAQEKVARVFGAPKAFYDSFTHISDITRDDAKVVDKLPLGATVPVLGLSNKAVYEGEKVSLPSCLTYNLAKLYGGKFSTEV